MANVSGDDRFEVETGEELRIGFLLFKEVDVGKQFEILPDSLETVMILLEPKVDLMRSNEEHGTSVGSCPFNRVLPALKQTNQSNVVVSMKMRDVNGD